MGTVANIKAVDFNKLSDKLYERGLNLRSASIRMGKSDSYLGGMKKKEYLTESTLIMLNALWNIKYDDIAPAVAEEPNPVEGSKPTESESLTITKEELRCLITEAIKDAFVWYANM